MTSGHLNPAVYAGVAGALAWGTPACAQALTVLGQDLPVENPGVAFMAGCAVGALVASGTSLALTHRVASRVAREVAEERVPAWHTAEAAPVQADWSADTCENASESQVDEAPHAPRAAYAAHAAQTSGARQAALAQQTAGARQAALAQQTAGVHQAVPVHQKNPTGQVLSSDDYADVAEAYVHSRTVAERMSSRAKGVAEVLSERLNASRMSGIPVIERADGSVGDVGEPWWDEAVAAHEGVASGPRPEAPTPAPVPSSPASAAQSVAPAWVEPQERTHASAAPAAAGPTPAVASQATRVMPSRDIISARIASPALDAAPGASVPANVIASSASAAGQRWDEEHQDLWAVALEALDERYQEQIGMGPDPDPEPVFSDDLGDGATLDEPDGLERSTKFMTFRPQAGHPEVTDADSYVNLLIRQEFAKSRSAHRLARRSFREHLKVIDGGTGEEPTSRLSGRHLVAQA